jgi:hypothetical protein
MQRKLSEVLRGEDRALLQRAWSETQAAEDFGVLPAGEYVARIIEGQLATSRNGKPEYQLTFQVLEGEYKGRRFWHHLYLTAAALPMTKRDLTKLGVTSPDQLDTPLQPRIRCRVQLAVRRDDDKNQSNRVRSFEVIGIDEPPANPFAPPPPNGQAEGGKPS